MQCNKKSRGDSTFRFSQQHLVQIKKQRKNFRSTQLTLKPSCPNGQNREDAAMLVFFISLQAIHSLFCLENLPVLLCDKVEN